MIVIEKEWGKIVKWGYNCEEDLRDLRKLNGAFSEHHPDFESMCKRSDALAERCLREIEKADAIYKKAHKPWTQEEVDEYDEAIASFEAALDELNNLCCIEYPNGAHVYHYSYCV